MEKRLDAANRLVSLSSKLKMICRAVKGSLKQLRTDLTNLYYQHRVTLGYSDKERDEYARKIDKGRESFAWEIFGNCTCHDTPGACRLCGGYPLERIFDVVSQTGRGVFAGARGIGNRVHICLARWERRC